MDNRLDSEFIISPFSVIDRRTETWRMRTRLWRSRIGYGVRTRENAMYPELSNRLPELYIRSKSDREGTGLSFEGYAGNCLDEAVVSKNTGKSSYAGVSAFDPTLAEIIYKWFTPYAGSKIFDCFAGGVTKGAVACECGHSFTGIELRKEQVEVNNRESAEIGVSPKYIEDDGRNVCEHIGKATQDLFVSCPPYYNLEVYSGLENDASNQKCYGDFIRIVDSAFKSAVKCLKSNRFAVVIVGDLRNNRGAYYGLPYDIVRIFEDAGCVLWNEIIVISGNPLHKIRARKYMKSRKVVRVHEKVLVFYKGNPHDISRYFRELSEPENKRDDIEAENEVSCVIRNRISDLGLSQSDLCRELDISNPALSEFLKRGRRLSVGKFSELIGRLGLIAMDSDGKEFDFSVSVDKNLSPIAMVEAYSLKLCVNLEVNKNER